MIYQWAWKKSSCLFRTLALLAVVFPSRLNIRTWGLQSIVPYTLSTDRHKHIYTHSRQRHTRMRNLKKQTSNTVNMRRVSRLHRASLPHISTNRPASTISVVRRPAFPSKPLVWQPIPLAEASNVKARPSASAIGTTPQQREITASVTKQGAQGASAVGTGMPVAENVVQPQTHWLRLT